MESNAFINFVLLVTWAGLAYYNNSSDVIMLVTSV